MSKIGTFREWLRESELNEAKKAQIIELTGRDGRIYSGIEVNAGRFHGRFYVNPNGNGDSVETTAKNYIKKINKLKTNEIQQFVEDEVDSMFLSKE
jgi:tetrahydromethanopterin S-methyltransferase subunit F